MKQSSDIYTQELNLEPRQQSDGERAAWLAGNLFNCGYDECLEAVDLLRKYSELEETLVITKIGRDSAITHLMRGIKLARDEYLEQNADGETDCVTPYDTYFYDYGNFVK